jgi:hypothetical protein
MKKQVLITAIIIFTTLLSFGQEQLNINTIKSNLKWNCDYAFYFGGHYGDVKLKEGFFIKTNNVITGGTFIIDLNSITNTDIENEEANTGLIEHIKNEDFFNVAKYPSAKLVITKTKYDDNEQLKIYANLTIKGITKPIDFQAKINYEAKTLTTKLKIDRTLWNINYKSKSAMDDLKNTAIADGISFEITLAL